MPQIPTIALITIAGFVMWLCLVDASQMHRQTQHGTRLLVVSAGGLSGWSCSTCVGVALGAGVQANTPHAVALATGIAILLLAATRMQGHYKN